jgi:hypothetical protein
LTRQRLIIISFVGYRVSLTHSLVSLRKCGVKVALIAPTIVGNVSDAGAFSIE